MADISNSRFTPTAEELYHVGHQSCNTIPRGVKERCLSQIAEVLRFRLELKPVISLLRGELYARQAIDRGGDMCYTIVIPSIRLYRFEVGNILGEVQDTINRRYGIYLHHSDLTMEQADGNPVNRGYNFLDVVFSSLSSNWGQNFTPGYKICNLVVNYEQNIEALMLSEEVHLSPYESSGLLSWFGLWKRDEKESCIFNHDSICFSFEKDGMRIHVSFRFASLRIA